MKIIYMGTPDFAVEPLRRLVEAGKNIVAVVTMPDKPAGRGHKIQFSPIKEYALSVGLPILQPINLKDPEFIEELRSYQADLQIVVAFRMLPEIVWNMPPLGTFNLHASLLPQYRGAAPINWAVINGETETGVTTFLLNHQIDTGDIIGQVRCPILPEDNIGTLYDKLMEIGSGLVLETVEKIAEGNITPIAQSHIPDSELKPAPKIFKEDCVIDWTMEGKRIVDFVRGLAPYPAAWSRMYKEGAEVGSAKIFSVSFEAAEHGRKAGDVHTDGRAKFEVACKDGWIALEELQLAGKRRMTTRELLLGWRDASEVTFE